MTMLRAIFLDFDGVIVESVGVKDRAFALLFGEYPEHLEAILSYHQAHNAVIRFEKFQHIATHLLKIEYTPALAERWSQTFEALVFKAICECPEVRGARNFLEHFAHQVPLYLISMSPAEELHRILEARGLKSYFQQVYAYPWRKPEAMREILNQHGWSPADVIYIGDSPEDDQAAQEVGIPFLGRYSNKTLAPEVRIFPDLKAMQSFLTQA